jgi:hypothetical protein
MVVRHGRMRINAGAGIIAALVCLAVLMAPANAQRRGGGERKQDSAAAEAAAEKKQKAREADEAYKAALKVIPDKPKADPWRGIR